MADGWYSLIALAVGALSGFQGVYERFRADSLRAVKSPLVGFYLALRGGLAWGVFEIVSLSTPLLSAHPAWRAFLCGTGAEAVLRSKIYFTRVAKEGGNFEEYSKGLLDLLRFFQDFFLTTAENTFVSARIARVELVAGNWSTFTDMCVVFDQNILSWRQDRMDVKELQKTAKALQARFEKDTKNMDEQIDKRYRHELCYLVINNLGLDALKTVFIPPTSARSSLPPSQRR
jgi:hypothetical protein